MSKRAVLTSCLAASLTVSSAVWADPTGSDHFAGHMWGGSHGWFFGLVMMLLFLAVFIAFVVLLVRWISPSKSGSQTAREPRASPSVSPIDILKERFAKGEIDQNEFEARRKILDN